MIIVREPISQEAFHELARDVFMVKVAVDIEREILAAGCELHVDCAEKLAEEGSSWKDLWGANVYPHDKKIDSNPSRTYLQFALRAVFPYPQGLPRELCFMHCDRGVTQRDGETAATPGGYSQFPQDRRRFGLGGHKAHLRPYSLVLRKLAYIASGDMFEMGSVSLINVRPAKNRSMDIHDAAVREKVETIMQKLLLSWT